MAVRIVRLGSERLPDEGLRIGTVRHPPRGVRKEAYAAQNFFDVWFPVLAPSAETLREGRGAESERDWKRFVRRYRSEMATPECRATLALLAALSHGSDFSVGCYCDDEARCHRSVLRELLGEHGARLA
jgi:uncharacterized protein YeaO (DUF488 family)